METHISIFDVLGPLAAAPVFCGLMALLPEPHRREYNAVFVAGASGVYLSGGGFGVWELPFIGLTGGVIAYLGLRDPRWTGLAWILHGVWDILHHAFGNPLWPFAATSSFGCWIFDWAIAVWFLAGAPSPWKPAGRSAAL